MWATFIFQTRHDHLRVRGQPGPTSKGGENLELFGRDADGQQKIGHNPFRKRKSMQVLYCVTAKNPDCCAQQVGEVHV